MLLELRTDARGRPRIAFNKLSLFRPRALRETGFGPGRHAAEPVGDLRLPARDEVMLWHYKHLGFERNAAREAEQARRLGATAVEKGFGQHYLWGRERLRAFWDEMEATSRDLAAPGFDPAAEAVRPLWWEGRPSMIRVGEARPAPSVPARVLAELPYEHPAFTTESVTASRRLDEISGPGLAFAGAYHGWGFHEDGAASGLRAARRVTGGAP